MCCIRALMCGIGTIPGARAIWRSALCALRICSTYGAPRPAWRGILAMASAHRPPLTRCMDSQHAFDQPRPTTGMLFAIASCSVSTKTNLQRVGFNLLVCHLVDAHAILMVSAVE